MVSGLPRYFFRNPLWIENNSKYLVMVIRDRQVRILFIVNVKGLKNSNLNRREPRRICLRDCLQLFEQIVALWIPVLPSSFLSVNTGDNFQHGS